MSKYIRQATIADVKALAPRLRKADKDEVRATIGFFSTKYLLEARCISDLCNVLLSPSGDVVGIYGVVNVPAKVKLGAIWMHATDELTTLQFTFLKNCKKEIQRLNEQYALLFNFVDARNTVHIKWLQWCGFNFINKRSHFGEERRPFYEFVRLQKCAQ